MTPDVSVIVPAHNEILYVTACVESVMAQSIGRDRLELIVTDNGSTDGTANELDRLATIYPEMRVIHQENTGGPAEPRNRGIELAEGRYLFFLDADDRIGVEALERMVSLADEQGTDVVLGRIVGVGGRRGPASMFTHNQPRTDVFHSRVYWTLNPMKLFRRELIERLGLRFPHELSPAEDQPFVATAYLNASGISVIANYDCVYWTERGDSSNLSNAASLASQIRIHSVMLPLIAENVPPGRDRDHLLQRHFEMGLFAGVRFLAGELDPDVRSDGLARIKGWVDELYNEDIGMRLRPVLRLCYELVKAERLEDVEIVLDEHRRGGLRVPIIDSSRAYDPYPFFRDSGQALPDYCYDVTDRIRVVRHLSKMSWKGLVLRLSGHAYIEGLDSSLSRTSLVLRKRDFGTEFVIDTEATATPALAAGQGLGVFDYGSAGFAAEIDTATVADGGPLAEGLWDILVRVEHEGVVREGRLGGSRNPGTHADRRLRLVITDDDVSVVSVYDTARHGNITLDMGEVRKRIKLTRARARWSPTLPGVLEVAGSVNALRVPAGTVSIRLTNAEGVTHEIAAMLRKVEGSTSFFASVPVRTAADGQPLPSGDWRLTTNLHVDHIDRTGSVTCAPKLRAVRWWNGVRPMHAKLLKDDEGVLLRIRPVNLARAAGRRLGTGSSASRRDS